MSRVEEAFRRAGRSGPATAAQIGYDVYPAESEHPIAAVAEPRRPSATVVAPRADNRHSLTRLAEAVDGRLVIDRSAPAGAVEEYRRLAATLHLRQQQDGLKVLMVSSALPRDGKTLTSINLALTLSEAYARRVLLVDADLRRPSIHDLFRLPNTCGLSDALVSDGREPLPVIEIGPLLSVVPTGRSDARSLAALTSDRMRDLLAGAQPSFDWIIVDTPPVGLLSDANLLARAVDAVVLVIGAGSTPYAAVRRAVGELGRERVAGVVLNRTADGPARIYRRYYADAALA